ncbi:MAG: hypothetical protein KF862_04045 [Chitinophagaceae bacterium]|nr:hypothetical protein [Chitinophagaceae bacterium]
MKYKMMLSIFAVIAAITLALGITAFKSDKLADFDYVMTSGNPALNSDRINSANYTKQTGTVNCPEGSDAFCKIHATDNGSGKPIITSGTALYNALNVNSSLPTEVGGSVWRKAN